MTMPSRTKTLLLAAAMLMGIACKDSTSPPAGPPAVASVTVAPSPGTLPVGSTAQLTATTKDSAGNVLTGRAVTWASSNTVVATVSATGLVTGVAVGSATITATSEGKNGTAAVAVTAPPVPVASVTVAPATVLVGVTVQLTATTRDAGGNVLTGRTVTWATSNPAVTTVNSTGLATGVAAGQATITATSEGQSGAAAITVSALTFATVSAGANTCGVTTSGAAYCWGSDLTPAAVAGGFTFKAVSTANPIEDLDDTCGVTTSGATYCWGYDFSPTPVAVADGFAFVMVSTGGDYTCGVTAGGAAYCWGANLYGQLGNGTTTSSSTPVPVAGGYTFSAVSAGGGHICGVTTSRAAYCWGYNYDGELGNGTTTGPQQCGPSGARFACSSTPVAVAGGYTFSAVSAGGGYTCGVTTGGAAYCWGYNGTGELGTGLTTSSSTPVAVLGGHTFSAVSATGFEHTCGVTTDGTAYCWGDNFWGELGSGTTTNSSTPVPVLGGHTFVTVSGGGYYIAIVDFSSAHTCGVTTGGVAYCWGSGSTVPVKVAGQP